LKEEFANIDDLFPTPVLKYRVPESIMQGTQSYYESKQNLLPQNDQQYSDFFDEQKDFKLEELPELHNLILNAIDLYVEQTGITIKEDSFGYWTQDYRETGQYHELHAHGVSGISGVYWIQANDAAGQFVFHNPDPISYFVPKHRDSKYVSPKSYIKPAAGMLILFPSYIKHEVEPSKEGAIRATLAFNLTD
tara:strand:+ start:2695 stop:3270 length:576 start_codon:yes stop_codon:yes gene_type:complete